MDHVEIKQIPQILTHTRFLLTLRSEEGIYHSLLLFRLSTGESIYDRNQSEQPKGPTPAHLDAESLATIGEQLYVMESACPHLGADLSHADIEECETGLVAVCPWHRYDFDLRTGKSDTGLKACTYKIELRPASGAPDGSLADTVWIESPDEGSGWRLVEFRPVSEEFADPPPPPDLSKLSLSENFPHPIAPDEDAVPSTNPPKTLIEWAVLILNTPNPQLKVERTRHAVNLFRTGKLTNIGRGKTAPKPPDTPPRESGMRIVGPNQAGNRKSRVAMLHALANIEQWAIDLAWDSIARFGASTSTPLPLQFFSDFTKVALDESKHFTLLLSRLTALSTPYGSLPIHAALWESATHTAHSLRSRLAIVHLVHEARGLDVNPSTIAKFTRSGDTESVKALEVIHADEVTHVTAGHRWFTWVCGQDNEGAGVDPVQAFREEVRRHFVGRLRGPFNEEDRAKAGLTREFYEDLEGERDKQPEQVDAGVKVEYEGTT